MKIDRAISIRFWIRRIRIIIIIQLVFLRRLMYHNKK